MVATLTETTKLWNKTLARVKDIIKDNNSFEYFLANTYIYKIENGNIILVADKRVAKPVIEGKYLKLLQDTVSDLSDERYTITVVLEEELKSEPVKVSATTKVEVPAEETVFFANASIKPTLTFNNFVVGEFDIVNS